MKKTVVTFPIGVRTDPPKIGLSIVPLVAQIIAKKTDSRFVLAVNSMDSFKDREQYLLPFVSFLNGMGIASNEVWHDADHKEGLQSAIVNLVHKGFVNPDRRKVLRCSCGKVEMLSHTMTHPRARLYRKEGDTLTCQCGTVCQEYTEDVLVMKFPAVVAKPLVAPRIMVKEVNDLLERISDMEYLVSRSRPTSISLSISGKKYWVDVDFFWLTYLSLLEADQRIIIGSNHVAWHLCVSHVLSQCLEINGFENNVFVLSPYVYSSGDFSLEMAIDEGNGGMDSFLPLYLLLSLAWSRKDSTWSRHYVKYLKRLNRAKQLDLLHELQTFQISGKINEDVLQGLISSINPQNIVSITRR